MGNEDKEREAALDEEVLRTAAKIVGAAASSAQSRPFKKEADPTVKPMLVKSAAYIGGFSMIGNIDAVLSEAGFASSSIQSTIEPVQDSFPRLDGIRLG